MVFSEEEEDRMMISRLMRGRLSSSVRALRRDVSSSHCHITEHEGLPFKGASRGYCIYRLFDSTSTHGSTSLTTLKHLQPILQISCRKYQVQNIVGLTFATSCLAVWNGNAEVISCEQVLVGKAVPPVQQTLIRVEEKKDSRVVVLLKFLWLPTLAVFTVVTGYHFPYSLAITLALLLWSTKPKANSIYDWVEKRRLLEAIEKQKIEKLGFNFNLKATVMHVEVRDYTLFCLAQVTSMTQTATLVGFLNGWLVIYSSSSTITALGLRSLLPTTPPALKKFLDRFDPDVVTENSVLER